MEPNNQQAELLQGLLQIIPPPAHPPPPLLELPESVLVEILGKLTSWQIAITRLVCRRLRDCCNKTSRQIKLDPSSPLDMSSKLSRSHPHLTYLSLRKPGAIDLLTDQKLTHFAFKELRYLRSLTRVDLEHATALTLAGLAVLCQSCPQIRDLRLPQLCQSCRGDPLFMVLAQLPGLQHLRWKACASSHPSLLADVSALTALTAMEVEDKGMMLLGAAALTKLSQLQKLVVWTEGDLDAEDDAPLAGWGGDAPVQPLHHMQPGQRGEQQVTYLSPAAAHALGLPSAGAPPPTGVALAGLPGAVPAEHQAGAAGAAAAAGAAMAPEAVSAANGGGAAGDALPAVDAALEAVQSAIANIVLQHGPAVATAAVTAAGAPAAAAGAQGGAGPHWPSQPGDGTAAVPPLLLAEAAYAAGIGGGGWGGLTGAGQQVAPPGGDAVADAAAAAVAELNQAITAAVQQLQQPLQLFMQAAQAAQQQQQALPTRRAAWSVLVEAALSLPSLTVVDLQRVDVGLADLKRFTALRELQYLGLGTLNLQPTGLEVQDWALTSVTKLVAHQVTAEQALPGIFPGLQALSCDADDATLPAFAGMSSLTHLFLWDAETEVPLGDAGLAALTGLRSLSELRLEGALTLTNAGWVSFCARHTQLTSFTLTDCSSLLTSLGFIKSLPSLRLLRSCTFNDCVGLDAAALAALLSFCTGLTSVSISDCPAMSLASVKAALAGVAQLNPDVAVTWSRGGASHVLHPTP